MSDVSMSENNGGGAGAGEDLPGERLAILDAGSQVRTPKLRKSVLFI